MGHSHSKQTTPIAAQVGRVYLVTGANTGIGLEACKILAAEGATVIMTARDATKGESARKAVVESGEAGAKAAAADDSAATVAAPPASERVFVETLDLSSFDSVRDFGKRANAKEAGGAFAKGVDAVILNAGVMTPPLTKTGDGFELQWHTNHLGNFVLIHDLLPLLRKSQRTPTVVPLGSIAAVDGKVHATTDFDKEFRAEGATEGHADKDKGEHKFDRMGVYSNTKQANYLFATELRQRHGSWLRVVPAHPGVSATELFRHSKLGLFSPLFQTAVDGARLELRAACDLELPANTNIGTSSKLANQKWKGAPVPEEPTANCSDAEAATALWTASEKATGCSY